MMKKNVLIPLFFLVACSLVNAMVPSGSETSPKDSPEVRAQEEEAEWVMVSAFAVVDRMQRRFPLTPWPHKLKGLDQSKMSPEKLSADETLEEQFRKLERRKRVSADAMTGAEKVREILEEHRFRPINENPLDLMLPRCQRIDDEQCDRKVEEIFRPAYARQQEQEKREEQEAKDYAKWSENNIWSGYELWYTKRALPKWEQLLTRMLSLEQACDLVEFRSLIGNIEIDIKNDFYDYFLLDKTSEESKKYFCTGLSQVMRRAYDTFCDEVVEPTLGIVTQSTMASNEKDWETQILLQNAQRGALRRRLEMWKEKRNEL